MSRILDTSGCRFGELDWKTLLPDMTWTSDGTDVIRFRPTGKVGPVLPGEEVVCVRGTSRLVGSDAPIRGTHEYSYFVTDYYVILEGPDLILYRLASWIPQTTPPAVGMVRLAQMTITMAAAFVITVAVSALAKLGWWTVPMIVGPLLCIAAYSLMFAYPIWTWLAGARGALYVRTQVLSGNNALAHYRTIIDHLRRSEGRDIAAVNAAIYRLI